MTHLYLRGVEIIHRVAMLRPAPAGDCAQRASDDPIKIYVWASSSTLFDEESIALRRNAGDNFHRRVFHGPRIAAYVLPAKFQRKNGRAFTGRTNRARAAISYHSTSRAGKATAASAAGDDP
jgi:hypothetical protein